MALSSDGALLAFVEGTVTAAQNLTAICSRTSLTFTGFVRENVILVDHGNAKRTCLLKGHPEFLSYLMFVSDRLLLAADAAGLAMLLDVRGGGIVTQWWTPARLVGHLRRVDGMYLADSGEGTNHAPVVYVISVHTRCK